jgi:hypothetical protein
MRSSGPSCGYMPSLLWSSHANLNAPSPSVMPDVGNGSTARLMVALTRVVNNCQGASCSQDEHREDNQKGVFIGTSLLRGPSTLPTFQINRGSNESPANVLRHRIP